MLDEAQKEIVISAVFPIPHHHDAVAAFLRSHACTNDAVVFL